MRKQVKRFRRELLAPFAELEKRYSVAFAKYGATSAEAAAARTAVRRAYFELTGDVVV
jgi:hypothetical protein